MKSPALVLTTAAIAIALTAASPPAPAHRYVCAPCDLPCDTMSFDHPGTCPKCGMALVDAASARSVSRSRHKVAILVFDGAEIIDWTGPYEVFGAAGYEVYTVAAARDPVTTAMGMTVVPKYDFAGAPQPEILVVPGGGVRAAATDEPTLDWVRRVTARTEHTLSVCNGAFILASAGLLDGLTATTTAGNIPKLRAQYPRVHVVDDQRWVDNGKIITTGGLSAGIDGALHVVARMQGEGTAQQVALGEEYAWTPAGGFTRAALADLLIPQIPLDSVGTWNIEHTEGGTDHWEIVLRGTSDRSAADLAGWIGERFGTTGHWTAVGRGTAARGAGGEWRFPGRRGEPWRAVLTVDPDPAAARAYSAKLTLARIQ